MTAKTAANSFNTATTINTARGRVTVFDPGRLETSGFMGIPTLPFSIKVLLESVLRNENGMEVTRKDVERLAGYDPAAPGKAELPFMPARVLLQDFTGVPAVVDLAAMRTALHRLGGDPQKINPIIDADLVIDHSIQVDAFGFLGALEENTRLEFERNKERYEFLRWGQRVFRNFRVIPPANGIVHQVNLEYLASGVMSKNVDGIVYAYPDSLVGTDSHTTMINGLGILGWGVGGIEAEAAMLGQPLYMLPPEVIGVQLHGQLPEGATATDLVLMVTQMLRKRGVVNKFVEFCGDGLATLSLPDRATIANMAPEYGATAAFFPMDAEAAGYLVRTGRTAEHALFVEQVSKSLGLWREPGMPIPRFTDLLSLDLNTVTPSLAGPKRPQDRIELTNMKRAWATALTSPVDKGGFGLDSVQISAQAPVIETGKPSSNLKNGDVVIAAITSCTNTSNPSIMIAAGLLAQKAAERGLRVKSHVKTSLAPGSRAVTQYLVDAGLMKPLEDLGFHVVGYGCTTCIGNSGPLPEHIAAAVESGDLVVASVLSGNRNFEGRINPHVRANFLASPPLVVAYALAGTVDMDFGSEPLGLDILGRQVFLKEIWPTGEEIRQAVSSTLRPEVFKAAYDGIESRNPEWNAIPVDDSPLFPWNHDSTYIQLPPYFDDMAPQPEPIRPIHGARVLAMLGDSVTTDHISPAGNISPKSPAGLFLQEHGVTPADFNSYGSRRGNDRVMTRGTFANIRLKNRLVPGTEGGITRNFITNQIEPIYDASQTYKSHSIPTIILAGKDYGMGSSRDWAAKGTLLLGVRAVIAESYERIHRSNLVGMGVLPLQFVDGQSPQTLGLNGNETFSVELNDSLVPGQLLTVTASSNTGDSRRFEVLCRIDTPIEVDYYRHGGVLPMMVRRLIKD